MLSVLTEKGDVPLKYMLSRNALNGIGSTVKLISCQGPILPISTDTLEAS